MDDSTTPLTIERIEELAEYLLNPHAGPRHTYARFVCNEDMSALLEAARRLLELESAEAGKAQAEWVSVDDRAPESGVYVLTCQAGDGPDDVRVLAWDDDRLHWVTDRAEDYCDRDDEELAPQFWQSIPLPPPPSAPEST